MASVTINDIRADVRASADGPPGPWARPIAVVTARAESGAVGLGEAAPFAGGRSRDDVGDVVRATALLRAVLPLQLPVGGGALLPAVFELARSTAGTAASARAAIEGALLDVCARACGRSLASLLGGGAAQVPINALVDGAEGARLAVARGVTTIKIKVGGGAPIAADLARLTAVRAAIGPDVALRVDVNRGWRPAEVAGHLAALAPLGLEYVEEPVTDVAALRVLLAGPLPCPIALDETAGELDDDALRALLATGKIAAMVLKPALLGIGRCLELAALARTANIDVVVTHAFDGPIGAATACELALRLATRRACGLDVHAGLDRWPTVFAPHLRAATVVATGRPGIGIDPAGVARVMAQPALAAAG